MKGRIDFISINAISQNVYFLHPNKVVFRALAILSIPAVLSKSPASFAATQCPPAPAATPAPNVGNGAVVYNPWYPGNVVPFFSAYPFVSAPYLIFDRPVPPPIPAPPPPPQTAAPPAPAGNPNCRCNN